MPNQVLSSSSMGMMVRKTESFKKPFKEKFVSLYEDIFAGRSPIHTSKEQGPQGHTALARFWDELLLLKVNEAFLAEVVYKATEEQLKGELRPVINELFATCVTYLRDGNSIRLAHALETLTVLLREIFKKRFAEQGFTIITLAAGSVENSDSFFRRLVTGVSSLLTRDDVPVLVKSLGLRVYLTILTATDNVNTNSIASYLFVNNIFDSILSVFTVKLTSDRKRLELDASLVLILLLLWRESSNPYAERLSSMTAPIIPLLHTISSILASPSQVAAGIVTDNFTSAPWPGVDGVLGYIGNLLGFFPSTENNGPVAGNGSAKGSGAGIPLLGSETLDTRWCNTTAALFLLYFLCYMNPVLKSTQAWRPSEVFPIQRGPSTAVQSTCTVWIGVFKTFLSVCKEILLQLPTLGVEGVLRAKLCLTVLRCMLEDSVSADFLARCDAESFSLTQVPANGVVGIPSVLQFKSVSCVILDLGIGVLGLKMEMSHFDTDLYFRAALLIPIILNYFKSQGWQLLPSSTNWSGLWQALMNMCEWCGAETMFERPGVPELAELCLGILELCLGSSHELCGGPEETDRLHAMVMSHSHSLEQLVRTASGTPFGDAGKLSVRGGIKLVNAAAVKFHYEVQIAALGVRGQPTFEQAILGVKKKGLANLKLKPRHAGPGHSYTEGTAELRLLTKLVRLLVAENRRHLASGVTKLEVEM